MTRDVARRVLVAALACAVEELGIPNEKLVEAAANEAKPNRDDESKAAHGSFFEVKAVSQNGPGRLGAL